MLKNNKILKISLCIIMIMILGFSVNTCISYASGDDFIQPSLKPSIDASVSGKISNLGGNILGVFQAVGFIAAVIVLVWLGIKYIMASPDGKAEIKKQAFAYILGAVLLFSAATIVTIIKGFTSI